MTDDAYNADSDVEVEESEMINTSISASSIRFLDGSGCPKCQSTRAQQPNLQICYSTCCGRILCSNCILIEFSVLASRLAQTDAARDQRSQQRQGKGNVPGTKRILKKVVMECPDCGQKITEKDWSDQNRDAQIYSRHRQIANRCNRVFSLHLVDFDNDRQRYNDYLEFQAQIVFDMTHGDLEEQKAAEKRLSAWQVENKALIDKSVRRVVMEERAAAQASSGVNDSINNKTAQQQHYPLVQAPLPTVTKEPLTREERSKKLQDLSHEERNRLLLAIRDATGYKLEFDRQRARQEAFETLFIP